MASSASYSRPIRRTTSGYFIQRATTVSNISLVAGAYDVRLDLYDGGPGGQIVFSKEADNAASSPAESFNPPMIFKNSVYGVFVSDGPVDQQNHSATICVIEPAEALA
jgi:hypothetical protein